MAGAFKNCSKPIAHYFLPIAGLKKFKRIDPTYTNYEMQYSVLYMNMGIFY